MKIFRRFFHSGLLASMLVSLVGAAQGPALNPAPADLSALGRRQPGTMATASLRASIIIARKLDLRGRVYYGPV